MITISGTYATAKIYTDVLEPSAEGQIKALCDQPFVAGSKIRIMPDVSCRCQRNPLFFEF